MRRIRMRPFLHCSELRTHQLDTPSEERDTLILRAFKLTAKQEFDSVNHRYAPVQFPWKGV